MPRLVDYYCKYCEKTRKDMYFPTAESVTDEIRCPICHHPAKRIVGAPAFFMDSYIPGTNGKRDMERAMDYYEHRLYSEDEQKQGIKVSEEGE